MTASRLRVLSYNIHKGMTVLNRKHVLRGIREAIRSVDPDLVFLQEVLGAHRRHSRRFNDWPTESQFEYLADTLWRHHAYGKNAVYDEGHHGNAVLSKYPILSWRNIDVSTNRFDRRGILHVTVDGPRQWGVIHGMCVHLGLTERFRKSQVGVLLDVAAGVPKDATLIVAGDFNDWSVRATNRLTSAIGVSEVFHSLHGRHAKTYPARLPLLKLDRIYFRGPPVVEGASVLLGKPWCTLSDHAALYAEFSSGTR